MSEELRARAREAILGDLRRRKLLKWLFREDADTNGGPIGYVDGPIDLTTQHECVDKWIDLTLSFASSAAGQREGMQVLLPPGFVDDQTYLEGWVDGQTYLIHNYSDDAASPSAPEERRDEVEQLREALQRIIDNDDHDATVADMVQNDRNAGYLTGVRDCANIARAALTPVPGER